jgi:hypothetical protein
MSYITYEVKVYSDGSRYWCLNGKLHREDGPAFEGTNGTKEWLLNGKRHREDGPAVEHYDGTKKWFLKGKHHREDGPAYEGSDGSKYWWLNNVSYSEEEWKKKLQPDPCLNKIVDIEGKKYKLVSAE